MFKTLASGTTPQLHLSCTSASSSGVAGSNDRIWFAISRIWDAGYHRSAASSPCKAANARGFWWPARSRMDLNLATILSWFRTKSAQEELSKDYFASKSSDNCLKALRIPFSLIHRSDGTTFQHGNLGTWKKTQVAASICVLIRVAPSGLTPVRHSMAAMEGETCTAPASFGDVCDANLCVTLISTQFFKHYGIY